MLFTQPAAAVAPAYYRDDHARRHRHAVIGSLLALLLVPGGALLDYFIYPGVFVSLLVARIVCDAALLPVFLMLLTTMGKRFVRPLSSLLLLLPIGMICWMIYLTDGAASPYYAGLTLMITVTCTILVYTLLEAAAVCAVVLAGFTAACVFSQGIVGEQLPSFVEHMFFLVATSAVCLTVCQFDNHRRVQDFELRHELADKNSQLTELDRLKSGFFASVSHELGTPLTLMLAPVEDLLHRRPPLPQDAGDSLTMVRANCRRLMRLIDEILEIIRLEEGRMRLSLQPLDLHGFLGGLVNSVKELGSRQEVDVRFEPQTTDSPVNIAADRHRLEKVILNLLTNAIKFTSAGGKVRVTLSHQSHAGEQNLGVALIGVHDTGAGIHEEHLPHVFDKFYQIDDARRPQRGLGLGLALAKELVEEHGGSISVSSQAGKGSSFEMRFDLATADFNGNPDSVVESGNTEFNADIPVISMFDLPNGDEHANLAPEDGATESTSVDRPVTGENSRMKATVLVVDDEPDMRRYLVSVLKRDFEVCSVSDGQQALDTLRQQLPEAVVLDFMLPEMDGVEVARAIRRDPQLQNIKILMLTARADEGAKLSALKAGVDDFINKPFSASELKGRLLNLLETSQLQRELARKNKDLSRALEDLKSAQQQLIQSEKMNALGSLAAGLLHEINNPLNFSGMALRSLRADLEELEHQPPAETHEAAADIADGLERVGAIITDLRAFAYPETDAVHRPFNLQLAVDTALRFTAAALAGVTVTRQAHEPVVINGSQTQITQLLVNLLMNAADATQNSVTTQPEVTIGVTPENGGVKVTIQDNGPGIPPDVLPRIYDPFFTTKDVEGTGLGLSVSHTIVGNHGGAISVESSAAGAAFTIELPQADAANGAGANDV